MSAHGLKKLHLCSRFWNMPPTHIRPCPLTIARMASGAGLLKTRRDAAITAIDAADWTTALRELRAAKVILATQPDVVHGDDSLKWFRDSIDALIKDAKQESAAATGIQYQPVTYTGSTA